ncbi:EsaB/YukD family protein [Nocardioides panaciterrulae]|uniref:EccD-like transmembrane domain-containing protein n=1 Tax=Nocardioides panaciterrulae TaxID=661492 RepID=A0A7Y9E9P1_9ACTN|nr:EsaB/YukD family protein [Nocardioides panaciterrulae]NYD43664.1 hypothetical protein [Nocardioides panaciterrulae]
MGAGSGGLALSVHGPAGVVDLVVPLGASTADVAGEYARQAGLPVRPGLFTRLGAPLRADRSLAEAGVRSGDLLVAADPADPPGVPGSAGSVVGPPDPRAALPGPAARPTVAAPVPAAGLVGCLAAAAALLAGWSAAQAPAGPRGAAVGLLVLAALLGVAPVGRLAGRRVVAAPAFGAAAAFAVAWDPHPARLPTIVGVSALAAAVVAALGRALGRHHEEPLRVWIATGSVLFVWTTGAALLGLGAQVSWAVLLLAAMLAARLLPGYAVDVPDPLLLDLDRLAVTAWSARERPPARRVRTLVPPAAVAAVAARGARLMTAYAVAVLAVAALSAPLLLASATLPIDRIGARLLVLLCGGGLLLAARSYRHVAARRMLRLAGLACLAALVAALAPAASGRTPTVVLALAVLLAAGLVLVAVATGRGWRSAWWARRAEVTEALCGAVAVATLLVACGVFRSIWESIHLDV